MNVIERIAAGAYEVGIPRPQQPQTPRLSISPSAADRRRHNIRVDAYEVEFHSYEQALRVYGALAQRARDQFRMDLEQQHGTANHPLAQVMFDRAWTAVAATNSLLHAATLYENLAISNRVSVAQTG